MAAQHTIKQTIRQSRIGSQRQIVQVVVTAFVEVDKVFIETGETNLISCIWVATVRALSWRVNAVLVIVAECFWQVRPEFAKVVETVAVGVDVAFFTNRRSEDSGAAAACITRSRRETS